MHLRRELGFGDADPVLLVLGRLEPQKGHRVLIEALPAVRRQFPSVRLVCAGEGGLRGELESQVRDLDLQAAVRFVGFQSDIGPWLQMADVGVLPSFYEGLPLVAIESLAAGLPMVATAVDGTPEVVVDGRTGFTVPPGEPAPLAHALCRLLADGGLRSRFAENGRRWVGEHFSRARQVRETEELYVRACKRAWSDEKRGEVSPGAERTAAARKA
jgi:glycosyltransferase involved in cell wall biosynthesis